MIDPAVFLLTCPGREPECARTLASWAETDWRDTPPIVHLNPSDDPLIPSRIRAGVLGLLQRALDTRAAHFLLLEDDLRFNRHLRANLTAWPPWRRGEIQLASLYHCGQIPARSIPEDRCVHADPRRYLGGQARLISRAAAAHILARITPSYLKQDEHLARLAAELGPIHIHLPSLIQHEGTASTWGGLFHRSLDFDEHWRAQAD